VSERATLREMIEHLENEKVAQNDGGLATVMPMAGEDGEDRVKQMKKKTQRKLKEKEVEIRTKEKLIEDLKDEVHRGQQVETQLE
jgi:hypothetical protein